jgi:lipopolysaccharide heptosyltransferase I
VHDLQTVNRVLLVRLGALGDIVHAIPVAAALRRAFPAARIDWLVSAKHRELLDLVPVIDRRLAIGDGAILDAVRGLRRARYDVALDLQGLIKSAMLARGSGARRVIGLSSRYLRERAARLFYTEVHEPAGPAHVIRLNLGLIERLGVTAGAPEFPIDQVESAVAREVGERTGRRYALLNPGAAWPNKRWPAARFAAVAIALRDRHALPSVVLWGPGEQPLAEEVVAAARGAALISPPPSVSDLVALARGAVLMLSGDTGPTHIAAAVGTPVVGIFGPTRPQRNGPWSPDDVTVSRDAICECHHLRRCKRSTMCLLDIGVDEVVEAIGRRLAGLAAGASRV